MESKQLNKHEREAVIDEWNPGTGNRRWALYVEINGLDRIMATSSSETGGRAQRPQ